jgi:hypothetical protein
MHPHKQKKLSASRAGPRADKPKTLPGEIVLNAAMLASDAGECWKTCQYRSCRNAQGCQGEEFGKCEKCVACAPRWTEEQEQRFLGAMYFGFIYLLPKTPDGVTMKDLALKEGEKNPYDMELLTLHMPRGARLKIICDDAEEYRLPFWAEAPKECDDVAK